MLTALTLTVQQFVALPTPFHYVFAALIGLTVGSFLTVVVHRLPIMLEMEWETEVAISPCTSDTSSERRPAVTLCAPRSGCPACGHVLKPWENLPILSYLLLKGRCGSCDVRIASRYLLLEAATGVIAIASLWRYGLHAHALAAFVITATLLTAAAIDATVVLLPDIITVPLLWAGLTVNAVFGFVPLHDAVLGAIVGYGTFWLLLMPSRKLSGSEPMGFGDFKLYAALGAWFGWMALPQIFLLSIVAAGSYGVWLVVARKKGLSDSFPLGPFIAAAGAFTAFFGIPLTTWLKV